MIYTVVVEAQGFTDGVLRVCVVEGDISEVAITPQAGVLDEPGRGLRRAIAGRAATASKHSGA